MTGDADDSGVPSASAELYFESYQRGQCLPVPRMRSALARADLRGARLRGVQSFRSLLNLTKSRLNPVTVAVFVQASRHF